MDTEITDIPGYEGRYAVTRDGRIWSHPKQWIGSTGGLRSHNGFWMKAKKERNGYYTVSLLDRNVQSKTYSIHRLVARIYIPNPDDLPQVNHKNCNKADNRVENLEWMTSRENIAHAIENNLRHGALGEKNGMSKLTLIQVINIHHCFGSISTYKLAKRYGVAHSTIHRIWRGKCWNDVFNQRRLSLPSNLYPDPD